jgi:hypothetical protein
MQQDAILAPAFVIKAVELPALNYLAPGHPNPRRVEWINRATDQILRRSSVDMLLRTLFRDVDTPSVIRLHQFAGLRAIFGTSKERDSFGSAFAKARAVNTAGTRHYVTTIFDGRDQAERAVLELKNAGIPDSCISLLWLAGQFMDPDVRWSEGHSKLSVARVVAGGGVAGAMLGVGLLAIPGVGPVAAVGAIAASALSSVATVSGVIGAAGGAIAKMLTDHDVDGVSATYYQQEIRRGKIFVSVDMRIAEGQVGVVRQVLKQNGGRTPTCADPSGKLH